MDEKLVWHALKDIGIEIMDLHARINALEKRTETGETVLDNCADDECNCDNVVEDI